jgi:hypothetical protein
MDAHLLRGHAKLQEEGLQLPAGQEDGPGAPPGPRQKGKGKVVGHGQDHHPGLLVRDIALAEDEAHSAKRIP